MKQLTEGCTDAAQEDTGHYGQRHEEAALHSPAGFKSWPCLISISRFVTSAGPLATKTKQNTVATMALIPLIFISNNSNFHSRTETYSTPNIFTSAPTKKCRWLTNARDGDWLLAGSCTFHSGQDLSSAHRLRHFCAMRPARSAIILFFFFFFRSAYRCIHSTPWHLIRPPPLFELRVLTFKSAPLFISWRSSTRKNSTITYRSPKIEILATFLFFFFFKCKSQVGDGNLETWLYLGPKSDWNWTFRWIDAEFNWKC